MELYNAIRRLANNVEDAKGLCYYLSLFFNLLIKATNENNTSSRYKRRPMCASFTGKSRSGNHLLQ